VLAATFFESLIYAVVLYMMLGYFVHFLPSNFTAAAPVAMAASRQRPGIEDFVLFCGAGVYEELVFRVFLLALLMLVFTKLFHMEHAYAAAWSTIAGAVIFSAFHHIGGEPFHMSAFLQRIVAGIYFSAIYFTRSFGVAAASHALYDIVVGLDQWKHG
jgi:membrane protease YdiL (CAAX protease family)